MILEALTGVLLWMVPPKQELAYSPVAKTSANVCSIEPYFTPTDSIAAVMIDEFQQAKRSIHIASYGITNPIVVETLIEMKRRGVEVILIEDKVQSAGRSSLNSVLQQHGITVIVKPTNTLMHNKYAIIDGRLVMMGSWNFSRSAEKQDNSMVKIQHCPGTVQAFEKDFQRMKGLYVKQR